MAPLEQHRRRRLSTAVPKLVALLAVAVLGGVVVAGMALPFLGPVSLLVRDSVESFEDLPQEFREPALPVRTRIYAADGTRIATVFDQNRTEVSLKQVAPIMRQAVVAIEDSRFYEHNGVDPRGMLRAAFTNLGAGEVSQGGSTLTMQYVKNVLLTSATTEDEQKAAKEDTISRKLREMRYAMALEKKLTKDEILLRYLNISYYGARAYGVEAASQRYFSKRASELNLVEAATLAGIVQQPSRFDPTRNPKQAQARRDVVLNRMAELGYITVKEARAAKAKNVKKYLRPSIQYNGCTTSFAPYFCDYAVRMVKQMKALGATEDARAVAWREGGYKIYTTLDVKAQKAATRAAMSAVPAKDPSGVAVAVAMVTPGTGDIRALTQNRKWSAEGGRGNTTINYSVNKVDGGGAGAAAGSTFKLFTLAAALEQGISPFTALPSPPRKAFTGFTNCDGALMTGRNSGGTQPYIVGNSTSSGTFDMFRGTAYSVNTFFVELEKRAGVCETVDVAKRLGVRHATGETLGDVLPSGATAEIASFTLGSTEVSPLTLANAYATVSAHGVYCAPRVITKIVDRYNRNVPVPAPQCNQALSRNVADATAAILTSVVDGSVSGRTGSAMSLGRDTTGKTGTINSNAAVWFAGATPDLSAAVWVGNPLGGFAHPLRNVVINGRYFSQVFGSSLPGPVWKASMLGALSGSEPVPMQLQNQWGLGPARQVGTPAQLVPIHPPVARPQTRQSPADDDDADERDSRDGNRGNEGRGGGNSGRGGGED